MDFLFEAAEFEWDEHNAIKNWKKHKVRHSECEEIFFDPGLKILPDETHSAIENRFLALGMTKEGRYLFAVFTQRGGKIRVISARDMSRKERKTYHEKIQKNSEI
ncbi:MAG: BrnT family toxin [Elusimicrobia bacterium]|nr:BrnT family toxin [Elusimicrobiota bacterium]